MVVLPCGATSTCSVSQYARSAAMLWATAACFSTMTGENTVPPVSTSVPSGMGS